MNTQESFWQFACRFYESPLHREQLLFMQNSGGVDVCFVLLALWHGRLERRHWTALLQQTTNLRSELEQLRRLRVQNKNRWPDEAYYQALKAAELALEKNLYRELEQLVGQFDDLPVNAGIKTSLSALLDCYHLPAGFVAPSLA